MKLKLKLDEKSKKEKLQLCHMTKKKCLNLKISKNVKMILKL